MNNPRTSFTVGTILGFLLGAVIAGAAMWWLGLASVLTGRSPTAASANTPTPARPGANPTPGGSAATPIPIRPPAAANDIVLSLSEPYLQAQLLRYLPPDGPLQPDPKLIVDDGNQLVLDGRIKISFGPLNPVIPARLRIGVRADRGKLGLSLDKVEVGPVPVPQNLIPDAAKATLPRLEEQLNGLLLNSEALRDMKVVMVSTDKGRLNLELDDGK